jgi:hypothetical protein
MDLYLNPTFLHYSGIMSGNLRSDLEAIKDEVPVFTEIHATLQHLIENQKSLPFEVRLLLDVPKSRALCSCRRTECRNVNSSHRT